MAVAAESSGQEKGFKARPWALRRTLRAAWAAMCSAGKEFFGRATRPGT